MNSNKLGYWIIWLILVSSVICYRFLLGVENPKEEPLLTAPFFLSISMVLGSLVCRVLILPKIKNKIQTYIIGVVMAESLSLIGIFLMPYYQDLFTTLSVAVMFCYLPIFIQLEEVNS